MAVKELCPSCGGEDFSWDGGCGGDVAKCLDCGRMVSPKEMIVEGGAKDAKPEGSC